MAFPKLSTASLAVLAVLALAAPMAWAVDLCSVPGNYFITMDVSGSVDSAEYTTEKNFVRDFVIASNVAGSKYLITSFDNTAYPTAVANSFANPALDVAAAVNTYIRPGSGSTGTGNAIKDMVARATLLGVTKGVLVVITDGVVNTGVAAGPEANLARALGLTVVAVGVGPDVSLTELNAIAGVGAATNPGVVITITTGYTQLPSVLTNLIKATCPEPTCVATCTGRTAPSPTCPVTTSWTPCKSCVDNSLVLTYPGAAGTCTKCLAAGPDGLDSCFWCVTNALTLKKGKTALCSCCDKVANCYNTLENALVNDKGWERYVLRCKEKFVTVAEQNSCFWCLTNALTTDPKTCTKDTLELCPLAA